MKTRIDKSTGQTTISLPEAAAKAMENVGEADVFVLGEGVLLVCAGGKFTQEENAPDEPAQKTRMIPTEGALKGTDTSSAWDHEQALLHKLSLVAFKDRLVPPVDNMLDEQERRTLQALLERKVISIYKNEKYPKGVYNIPRGVYIHAARGADGMGEGGRNAQSGAGGGIIKPYAPAGPGASNGRTAPPYERAGRTGGSPAPAYPAYPSSPSFISKPGDLNTVEHLIAKGYMVLDNENEAKTVMPHINAKLKNETVKGIRGFDRKYYVLRRSFLMEYESRLLPILDAGAANVKTLGEKLGLDENAVTVLLMILGDDGEVIELKKGMWRRA
ncbi:MAG: hypothetical protein V1728_00675 [Candidatus Micrarchaeota archaeon]